MKIEFNKVTWYSKLAAAVIFVLIFFLAFCFGREFEIINQKIKSPEAIDTVQDEKSIAVIMIIDVYRMDSAIFDLENRTFTARNVADKKLVNVIVEDSAALYSQGTWRVNNEWFREDFSLEDIFSIFRTQVIGYEPPVHFTIKGVLYENNTIVADEIFFGVQ